MARARLTFLFSVVVVGGWVRTQIAIIFLFVQNKTVLARSADTFVRSIIIDPGSAVGDVAYCAYGLIPGAFREIRWGSVKRETPTEGVRDWFRWGNRGGSSPPNLLGRVGVPVLTQNEFRWEEY